MTSLVLRRFSTAIALVLALAVLSGCVQSDEKTTLRSDGSGTVSLKVTIDESLAEQLKEAMGGMGGEGSGGPAEDLDPDKLKEKVAKVEGLELVRADVEVDEENHTRTFFVEIKFDSMEAFFRADVMPQTRGRLEQTEEGLWVLTRESGDPNMNTPEAQEMMAGFLMMLQPYLENLKMEMSITVPGTIVETNGKKDGDNRAVWSIGFEDLTKPVAQMQTVSFRGEGLSLTAFDTSKPVEEPEGPVTPGDGDEGDDHPGGDSDGHDPDDHDGGMGGGG
ncbi:MAG: LppM family (lipo)protein [Planctomycetota bacterium]|jgi:hypothetical protein